MFDWQRFFRETDLIGLAVVEAGVVEGPPGGPFEESRAYPLAVDRDGEVAAVSFAAWNAYPSIAPGWWSVAVRFAVREGTWRSGDCTDIDWSQRPFERPAVAENSHVAWIDWQNYGALGCFPGPDGEPHYNHLIQGIAPTGTERLTLTDETGRVRDLAITPWCGAYVAAVDGAFSRLTAYGPDGRELGSVVGLDGSTG